MQSTTIEVRTKKGKVVQQFQDIKLFHNWVNRKSVEAPVLVKTLQYFQVETIKTETELCLANMNMTKSSDIN